ncbi:hypothetical protein GGR54DRAFT_653905 [Hypoxylon sp. NC1633]|nr:hypothetical protein GGR54DRAFT_653905 [Hypoxylon sp. NC1633]
MADFSWLRFAPRSRTPTKPRSPTPSERDPSRVPSHLSPARRTSLSPGPSINSSSASFLVREQDKVWYNPSLDQMVEALQVVIMTRGVLQPVPIEYNSYILHLIEGFAGAQERICSVEAARSEAELSLEHHLEHFKSVADEWLDRESGYKSEIKRLEVLLSRTSCDGLEAVTLARTNSVVDRNSPEAKQLVSKLKRLGTRATQGKSTPVAPPSKMRECSSQSTAKILDRESDFLMSETIRRYDAAATAGTTHSKNKRPRHAMPVVGRHTFATTQRGAENSTISANDTRPRPLFSDDIQMASEVDNRADTGPGQSAEGEVQPRRQIMGDLLGHEASHSGGESLYARPSHAQVAQEYPSKRGSGQASRDMSIYKSKHMRGLSGFSFAAGDDTFPILAGGRTGEIAAATSATERHGNKDIEVRQYNGVPPRLGVGDNRKGPIEEADDSPTIDLTTPSRSWYNRPSPAVAGAYPQYSRTTVDATIQTAGEMKRTIAPISSGGNRSRTPNAIPEFTIEDETRVGKPRTTHASLSPER